MAPDTCIAFLVRHGATAASAARPVLMAGRRTDSPLSEEGQRQAEEAARFLADRPIDVLYASPMLRAQQTAAAIGRPHKLEPVTIDALIEADLGTWEGLSWDDIQARDAEAYEKFTARPDIYGYGGGESITAVRDRALPALEDVMRHNLGRTIAIVTHRIVIRATAAHLLEVPLAQSRRLSPATCGISVLRYRKDELEMATFNGVFHLSKW